MTRMAAAGLAAGLALVFGMSAAAAPGAGEAEMATYVVGFLYRGSAWTPERTPEVEKLQEDHLANIGRLADEGHLILAGPFVEGGDLRGLFVFKTDSVEQAKTWCDTDPAVKAGRLRVELHPWYSAKGIGICPGVVPSAEARAPGSPSPPKASPESLSWLSGSWTGKRAGTCYEEFWSAPEGGTLLGAARVTRGGKTVFLEFMRIEAKGESIVMTVSIPGQADTPFALTKAGATQAVFENPKHDFPKRISYRRKGDGSLFARVDSGKEGDPMAEEYCYQKAGSMATIPAGAREIRKEVTVAAPPAEVWKAWTTEAGVTAFFAPKARVELAVGGPFEMLFDLEAPPGSQGSEGMRVLSFLPERMLSFEWNSPPHLPEVRNEKTFVVVLLEKVDETRTKVTLAHLGWREGGQWDQAYAYFQRAWGIVLGRLEHRFAKGPIDWENPFTPAPPAP